VEKYEKQALVRKTKLPLLAPILDLLNYYKITPLLRKVIKKLTAYFWGNQVRDLNEIKEMQTARVLKTHLPLYLLHPKTLDTSKVKLETKLLNN
jgi:hypothetical protein